MRGLLILLFTVFAASQVTAHPPTMLNPEQEKVTVEEVTALRKALADAIAARDVKKLREMYADSFVHTYGSGKVEGKDARLASVLAGDPVIETAPVEDLKIRIPGGWTAIATGISPLRSQADGKMYSYRWTAVYVRTERSWQVAASHATRLDEVKS